MFTYNISKVADNKYPLWSVYDALIQIASTILGYESENAFVSGLADVIEDEADGEDKFIASLILAKEIASRVNGRAVLWYD